MEVHEVGPRRQPVEGRPEAELLDYFQTYALSTPERARQSLRFITAPHSRSYIFTYSVGGKLVRRAMEAGNAQEVFRRLLTRPVTPGELKELSAS